MFVLDVHCCGEPPILNRVFALDIASSHIVCSYHHIPHEKAGRLVSQQPTETGPAYRYSARIAAEIEPRWQDFWREKGIYNAPNPVGDLAAEDGSLPARKLFIQDMFPYPSGAGLHVGHPLGYIATDVFARYHRMLGANVLHTLGYDAFGLPAEQYAVQTGTHPRTTTMNNIENMERQLGRLGLGHDKRRAIATTDTDYYRWTQWIFLQVYNSWYDEDAVNGTGSRGKARPISELIALYESGERTLATVLEGRYADRSWQDLTQHEKNEVIDSQRLVYRSHSAVNWCPGLGTVLANEEVTAEGKSERGNFPVFRKNLSQWMMRITSYADRLLDDLSALDWPEKVKSMQRNWIGRSRGAYVDFTVSTPQGEGSTITVFTTRPDTLFGATYMVLAPEHPLVDTIMAPSWPAATTTGDEIPLSWKGDDGSGQPAEQPGDAIRNYRLSIAAKSDLERQENKEKTGVFTGAYAINPLNGTHIPVFIADYVLTGYGTGAIMAVPAHDTRDFEFATQFQLPIKDVVSGGTYGEDGELTEAYVGDGLLTNSSCEGGLDINGLSIAQAKAATIAYLEEQGTGRGTIQYKLRDWLFARQRYWGEPFPIVYDENGDAHPLPESMLPVELPEVQDYKPVSFDPDDAASVPSPPLAKATDWVTVELDLGDGLRTYTRDTNVMPQWAGSSWYQLRYIDPTNEDAACDKRNEEYWLGPRPEEHGENDLGGIDLYVGGVEHAVLHLLYARFWHKVLFDLGFVTSAEPYRTLFNQGYIQAYAYTDSRGTYVPAAEVTEAPDGSYVWTPTQESALLAQNCGVAVGEPLVVQREYGKMGKSLKNAVSPDEMCDNYGADTLRVYEMSMGPLDQSRPWATKDVIGAHRFLQRVWRLAVNEDTNELTVTDEELNEDVTKALHRTIAAVREEYENLRNNTAVAKLIEFTNMLTKTYGGVKGTDGCPRAAVEPLVLMLAPVAPHIAEELWHRLGHSTSLVHADFPTFDEDLLVDNTIEIPVQINGKVKARIDVPTTADRDALTQAALDDPKVRALMDGKQPVKVIAVPGRMVNLVIT